MIVVVVCLRSSCSPASFVRHLANNFLNRVGGIVIFETVQYVNSVEFDSTVGHGGDSNVSVIDRGGQRVHEQLQKYFDL